MLMYKSNQQTESKTRQFQQLNQRLQLNKKQKISTETKLKLKRTLIVYTIDNKYYIEHSAAYALKLTSVRAIMIDAPHLIEIGVDILNKLKSDDGIEIEYRELENKKETYRSDDKLLAELDGLEQGQYGIGVHGIDISDSTEKLKTAESIVDNGLNINNNSKTILSTAVSFGVNENPSNIGQEVVNYIFGTGTKVNIIIAVPLYIQSESGEMIFLGFPEWNVKTSGQQYEEHCILDQICSRLKKIPSQFILGYYYESPDGSRGFVKNRQHYSNLNPEEKRDLFVECIANIDDTSKVFNDLIVSGNIEELNKIRERLEEIGLPLNLVNNAIALAKKYQEQKLSKNNNLGKKGVRHILIDSIDETESMSSSRK